MLKEYFEYDEIEDDYIDDEGHHPTWFVGELAWLSPAKCYVTINHQYMHYDGCYFFGNCIVIYEDGTKGKCNSWQLQKLLDLH